MPPHVYFDTDFFHNFAETFRSRPLPTDLRDKILFSPVTMMEMFSHLATHWGAKALKQIKGFPNWINTSHAGALPYTLRANISETSLVPLINEQ